MPSKPEPVAIYLEAGAKRTFASAVDWPGWCRGARSEQEAIAALASYGDRYKAVVRSAAPKFTAPKDASEFKIVKRLKGNVGTDFGVPSLGLPSDSAPMAATELERLARILEACWDALDRAAKSAKGLELRKGPRGGGRDLDKMIGHVIEADQAYMAQLGARPPKAAAGRPIKPSDLHDAMLAAFRARARGLPFADPRNTKKPWTLRYFARRVGWHVLDHAWEIEDRAIRR
ncbi:MAG TPA: DinB family protein [Candidatus Limnocylindria bacterium]|nr:DinB family protein [Candidatus Limnocylindria bacterium]